MEKLWIVLLVMLTGIFVGSQICLAEEEGLSTHVDILIKEVAISSADVEGAGFDWLLGVRPAEPKKKEKGKAGVVDPSDLWFRAYTVLREGQKAEADGNLLEALSKYNESKPIFDSLAREFPDFYPDLVRFRRLELLEMLENIREKMKGDSPPKLEEIPKK